MKLLATNSNKTKFLASAYFILVGLANLIDSIKNDQYVWRDVILLLVLSLPLIINKRLFYLGYGILASVITLPTAILYVILMNPMRSTDSPGFFILGLVVFLSAVMASLAFIYVGTFTKAQNRFKLI